MPRFECKIRIITLQTSNPMKIGFTKTNIVEAQGKNGKIGIMNIIKDIKEDTNASLKVHAMK